MCTLSFIPETGGYTVAMNRDELLIRARARVASIHSAGAQLAIYPEDGGEAGTWIAVNQAAITMALLNWSTPPQREKFRSRGEVIPGLIGHAALKEVENELAETELTGMRPFRLIGLFFSELAVREWRWDGDELHALNFDWERRHWFSSGLSEEKAATCRGALFNDGERVEPFKLMQVRELHSSHLPERGAFSVCVHRNDAQTQSYTEIEASADSSLMRYRDGSPCSRNDFDVELTIGNRIPVRLST